MDDESKQERIGPYLVEGRLGAGGMGEVYRAFDERLGRPVALKWVLPEAAESPRRQARLRREARAAALLSHPGIVQIFDILEAPDGDVIVMELAPGETLAERLRRGRLEPSLVVSLARQLAEALAAAHEQDLIHRDLKAENIMVSKGRVKILDFGLAKPRLAEPMSGSVTGAVIGTAHAMSPEQARGRGVGFRSDLFSLGAVIYEMAAGHAPFRGDSLAETLTRVCTLQPPPLDEVAPDIPEELSILVDRLLQKMPEARPESAAQVAEALARMDRDVSWGSSPEDRTATQAPSSMPAWEATLGPDGESHEPSSESAIRRALRSKPIVTAGGLLILGLGAALLITLPGSGKVGGWLEGERESASAESTLAQAMKGEEAPAAPRSALDFYRLGQKLLVRHDREGQIDRALEAFERALAIKPDYAAAHAGLATALWRQYRAELDRFWLDRARKSAERAMEIDPQLTLPRVALARIFLAQGDAAAAESHLDDVLRLDPAHAEAHWVSADLSRSRGDYDAARRSLEHAMDLDPEHWEYGFELASIELELGHDERAEALLLDSLRLAPDNAFAYFSLGAISHGRGEFAEAAQRFQRSIEIRPSPAAYSNLGTLYFFDGLYAESMKALERAVDLGAHGYQLWINLGDAYRWVPGHEEQAEEAYARALQLLGKEIESLPRDPKRRSQLALLLAKMGRSPRALEELERVEPASAPYVLYRMTLTYELTGRRGQALATLERALDSGFPVSEIESDPELTALRKDAEFHRILARRDSGPKPG